MSNRLAVPITNILTARFVFCFNLFGFDVLLPVTPIHYGNGFLRTPPPPRSPCLSGVAGLVFGTVRIVYASDYCALELTNIFHVKATLPARLKGSTLNPDKRLESSTEESPNIPSFKYFQLLHCLALSTSHTMASTPVWQAVLDEADDETVAAINRLQLQDLQAIELTAESPEGSDAAVTRQMYEDEVNQQVFSIFQRTWTSS